MSVKDHNPAQDKEEVHSHGSEMKIMSRAVPVFGKGEDPFRVVQNDHECSKPATNLQGFEFHG
jgi:hypothetical protein